MGTSADAPWRHLEISMQYRRIRTTMKLANQIGINGNIIDCNYLWDFTESNEQFIGIHWGDVLDKKQYHDADSR